MLMYMHTLQDTKLRLIIWQSIKIHLKKKNYKTSYLYMVSIILNVYLAYLSEDILKTDPF